LYPSEIRVTAHARLHLGFLDLEGSLGRRFGSLGMAIATPVTRLRLSRSPSLIVEGQEHERSRRYLLSLADASGCPPAYRLVVDEAIPAHAGLGSGSQLALAIGAAFGLLEGRVMPPAQVGAQLHRGARSGISTGTFQSGGLVVDGGKAESEGVPPIIVALPVPETWRVILLFDKSLQGAHGQNELDAFEKLPPFSAEQSAHLCRLTLMQALPALAEGDLKSFGHAVDAIQQTMGSYFAAVQGGGPYASPRVAAALDWLKAKGVTGLGQSSWGPTGFAFVESAHEGRALMEGMQKAGLNEGLSIEFTEPRNKGADIAVLSEHTNGQEISADDDIEHGGKTHA
jgi:beta-RFAP synthase